MPRAVRWGVIGSGGIARRRTIPEGIVPADNGTLVCVYDIDEAINSKVAGAFGADGCGSLEELLQREIDAVYVASPAFLHHGHVTAAARAGKHILCEKPLGLNVQQAQEIVRTCRQAGVLLGTALMMRFHAQHQAALRLIREGKLGAPVYGRAQLSCWYPPIENAWRQDPGTGGGGSLMDMGCHCIDLLEMFFGNVRRVTCFINNTVHDYASEDSAAVILSFENGAMGTVDTFFCIPDAASKNVLELYGSRGSILAQGTIGQGDSGEMVAYLQERAGDYDAQQDRAADRAIVIAAQPRNTYRAEIEEFGAAVLEKREPANGAREGLRSQRILAACYESAQTGRAVEI